MSFDFDVIVAGGGPAGSSTANFLRQRGRRVLVLERERFPRFHIGESLLPCGNDIWRELGVFDKMDATFIHKPGAKFIHEETGAEFTYYFDGAIRDVAEIRQRTFPVYARGVTHRGPYKDGPGAINVPISVGGMPVNPGDIVVGDQDGLLAFPPSLAATVIEKALAQEQNEHGTIHAIREGRWDRAFVDALEARCAN